MSSATRPHQPIDSRQVAPDAARLLRAYTREYRLAKRYASVRRFVALALAIAGPTTALILPAVTAWIAAAAGGWLLLGRLMLAPTEKRHVRLAVTFQERFDTLLFDLPWPSALAGGEPSEEDVAASAQRLADDGVLNKRIREGWYPSTTGLPYPVDVLVAQMSSVAWGRRQHASYYRATTAIAGLTFAIAIVGPAVAGVTLADWLVAFLLPAMPALLDAADLLVSHRDMSITKQAVERQMQRLWKNELNRPGTLTVEDCRAVQDEAFKLRAKGLQVPEWFYRINRNRDDLTMREAARIRHEQYRTAVVRFASAKAKSADY